MNASQLAYLKIKEKILSFSFSPGSPLREILLSEELGVTRTPVRDAIKKLETEGLVQTFPNRGAFVTEFSLKEIEDLLDVREALERKAVHLATRRANREELDRLRESLENISPSLRFDLHYELIKLSKNQVLISMWEVLKNRLSLAQNQSRMIEDRPSQAVKEHRKILDAIYSGDSEQAQIMIANHIRNVKVNLKAADEEE